MSFETEDIFRNIQKFLDQHSSEFEDGEAAITHAIHLHNAGLLSFDDEDESSRAMDLFESAMYTEDPDQQAVLLEEAYALDSDNLDIYCAWALSHFSDIEAISKLQAKADDYFKAHRKEIKESGYFAVENRPYFRVQNTLLDLYKEGLFMEEAEKIAKHILRFNSNDNMGVRYKLMAIYVNSFQHKQAKALFKRDSSYRSDDQMLFYMATSLILARDFKLAQQRIKDLQEINSDILYFFEDENFNELKVFVNLPKEDYRPNSKQSLAIALNEVLPLFSQSNLLYQHFKQSLRELIPNYFDDVQAQKEKNIMSYFQADKLSGKGIFANIASQYVRALLLEDLETADDFKTKTEKEVLAINGIGKGTINKLKANGVRFKES
ncbi:MULTISPECIES: hypothetical protein [Aerococcus]|uniref:hypothetical protein n=1 Tax=Aerococcus TaxID=1375 RepID=UPI0018A7AA77|nr:MULTISPECIES: hypothetical protein [Aerococcus]MCY3035606.1 hypothetical protein [Aerococcus sp. Group 2]MCY3039280.1 hypothetical protein [Aerococcus sp. Group 2]MCY3041182.1 hypothetical protein [Aerococcus sp. Group 2]MCY3042419.1 hypothetical protein [Aerococcus sp. Group 2]MDK6520961.1 hypothetical protein [Aerococcus urinae]